MLVPLKQIRGGIPYLSNNNYLRILQTKNKVINNFYNKDVASAGDQLIAFSMQKF